MHDLRKLISSYKVICWALIASVLILVLFPSHMHLHHDQEVAPSSHKHVVDVHVGIDIQDQAHHDGATVMDNNSSLMLTKKMNDNPIGMLLLVLVLLVLPIFRIINRYRRFNTVSLFGSYYQISPPLRAPPTL